MKPYYDSDLPWRRKLQQIYIILCTMNRRAELERLIEWANRKRLAGPRRAYQSRYWDEERRLLHYRVDVPQLVNHARILYRLKCLLAPAPRYYSRGAAAGYRRKT